MCSSSCSSAPAHPQLRQQLVPLLRALHGEHPEPVDHVARGHRFDRRVEVAGAGLQRHGDPQADDELGQAGVGHLALDPVAEHRGERLAGGHALQQLQRFAHTRRRHVEVERTVGEVGLAAAAQQRRRHGVRQRRRGDVAQAVGGRTAVGLEVLDPAVASDVDALRPLRPQLVEAGGGERREPGVEARAEQVEHAPERPLQLGGRCRREHVEGGEEPGQPVDRARRLADVLGQLGAAQARRHLVVHGDLGTGSDLRGERPC